jgi:glycosyltransferase involved in cell wall biosynthesis
MRILFLSNYYPPYARGGYEQWCHEVAEELAQRGNDVCVLTSKPADQTEQFRENGVEVSRLLTLEAEQGLLNTAVRLIRDHQRVEQDNLTQVRKLVTQFKPDVALIWGMWNIPRTVAALVEQLLTDRVAYYICDYWLTLPSAYIQRWREPAKRKWLSPAKRLLSKPFLLRLEKDSVVDLELKYPICVSNAVKDLLVDSHPSIEHARVVYGGTKVSEFSDGRHVKPGKTEKDRLKLLYVGRLEEAKGVHTAIHALPIVYGLLQNDLKTNAVTLDIIGNGDVVYSENLRNIVEKYGLRDKVTFLKSIPRSQMPEFMAQYDVLIFPSEWPEPFARTVLEAMAAGLVVIGTTTGGTGELLIDQGTGLTFPAGDAEVLASQICRIFESQELRVQLSKSGQERVREQFTFKSMVDQIQEILYEISLV